MFDGWSERRALLTQKMRLRSLHLSKDALATEPADRQERLQLWAQAANASSQSHGLEYDKMFLGRPANMQSKPFFCDWEQHPTSGKARPSSLMPTMLTHGSWMEHASARCMTTRELYSVHGWLTRPGNTRFSSNIMSTLAACKVSAAQEKQFLGNSMHIPSVYAVLLYGLSHMWRLSDVSEHAWRLTRKASSWMQEMGSSAGNVEQGSASSASTQPAVLKGKGKRGRGRKRAASPGPEPSPAFRRQKSSIFD